MARRTDNRALDQHEGLMNGGLGLAGEAANLLKKYRFHGRELDKQDLMDEIGDICWYLAAICNRLNVRLSSVLWNNLRKLDERHPQGLEVPSRLRREAT